MQSRRLYSVLARKRFYKNVSIVSTPNNQAQDKDFSSSQNYEVCLDGRKIRTPKGKIMTVPSEALAMAVAQEWRSQGKTIQLQDMHLTGLCTTCLVNPLNDTKQDLIENMLRYLDDDTLLYFQCEPESLAQLQNNDWLPVIEWIKEHYNVELEQSRLLTGPRIPLETRKKLANHLNSYDFWPLHGFKYAMETVKSLIITIACVQCRLNVKQAVTLANLEQNFQSSKWGRVEWAHDLDFYEQCCRLSASVLFIRLLTSKYSFSSKVCSI